MSIIFVKGQSFNLINREGNVQLIAIKKKNEEIKHTKDIPYDIFDIDDKYYKSVHWNNDVLQYLIKNDVKIDAITERELFKHTYSMFSPIKYSLINKSLNTVIPYKTNSSDAGFEICVNSLKFKKNNLYIYNTNLSFELQIGYYMEIHALNSLINYGYIMANGMKMIETSECKNEILIELIKFDDNKPDLNENTPVCKILVKKVVYSLLPKDQDL